MVNYVQLWLFVREHVDTGTHDTLSFDLMQWVALDCTLKSVRHVSCQPVLANNSLINCTMLAHQDDPLHPHPKTDDDGVVTCLTCREDLNFDTIEESGVRDDDGDDDNVLA